MIEREPYDSGIDAEHWAKIRQAYERDKGGEAKVAAACLDAGIDPRAAKLFCAALAFEAEATHFAKAAQGAETTKRESAEYLRVLNAAAPTTLDEAKKIRAEKETFQQKCATATAAIENARVWGIRLAGLQERLPALFGVTKPRPISNEPSPAYDAIRIRLGLPDLVDCWRHLNTAQTLPQPHKHFTTAQTFA